MYSKPKFRINKNTFVKTEWEFSMGLVHYGYEVYFYLNIFKWGVRIGYMYEPWEEIDWL